MRNNMRILLTTFAAAGMAFSQQAAAPAPTKIAGMNFSGSIRSRGELWDWFQADSGDNSYAFSGNIARFSLSQSRESWDWNAEFAVPFLLGLPENASAPGVQGGLGLGANYYSANERNRNTAMIFPKQLYVRITSIGGSKAHMLKLGRFEFNDGTEVISKNATLTAVKATRIQQRILGGFGWTHVGRSFDGVHYSYTKSAGNFTFVGAIPTRGVFQTDGWGWNKTSFGYAAFTRPWGAGKHAAETRAFGLFYKDWRLVLKTDNRPLAVRRADLANLNVWMFGGHTVHAISSKPGTIDLMLWGAGQTGRWGVQDHRAGAVDAEAGFQPAILPKLKPWLRGGFYWGSGDGNPADGKHETFFQVLPTPRPFARFPFFNMMNNQDFFGMLTLRPHPKLTASTEFHALRLGATSDLWYQGGGVFQPWTFGYVGRATSGNRSLANLYDVSADYRVHPKVTLSGYFGYAQGLATTASIYPKGKDGIFGYVEALYRF
jgi:hypothetical protein